MMEDGRGAATPGSLFGSYPSFGQGGAGGLTGLSPYLNVDPSYLQTQAPEFIRNEVSESQNKTPGVQSNFFLQNLNNLKFSSPPRRTFITLSGKGNLIRFIFSLPKETKRGNLENSFTAIGSSVLLGGAIGGAYGLYGGVRLTALSQMKGKLRRTQILNHTLKSGNLFLYHITNHFL